MALCMNYPILRHVERSSLVETIFSKLCDMVNDTMVKVREVACHKLGEFKSIPSELLCQTFSKDIISNKKPFKPSGKRGKVRIERRGVFDDI
jgi:hypothetical protein